MTNSDLERNLKEIGMHEQAVRVYLSVVKNVQLNANEIAKETGLPRSTVYLQSDNLVREGLLSSSRQNKTRYFTATPPQVLLDAAQKRLTVVESLIPSLRELSRGGKVSKPSSVLFVGKKSVRNALEDLLLVAAKDGNSIFSITHHDILKVFPRFFPAWIRKREQLKISTQIIGVQDSKENTSFKPTPLKEVRFLPRNFSYDGAFKIAGDRILFVSLDPHNLYAVQVDSPIMSKMCRTFFRYMWETTDKQDNRL